MQIFVRQFRNRETCHPAIWWNTTSPNCVIMHKRTNKTAKSSHLHGLYDFPISLAYVHVSHVFTNSSLPLSFCKSKEMFFVHLDHAARERYMKIRSPWLTRPRRTLRCTSNRRTTDTNEQLVKRTHPVFALEVSFFFCYFYSKTKKLNFVQL